MNQAVKRWVAVEPRPQSVMVLVSTGAGGWARMRLNQAVKRWVAVEPRPQSVQIIALALFARAWPGGHMVADGSGDVVGFCLVRSMKGNGSFCTRASEASPSQLCCYGPWCLVQLFRNAPIIIVIIRSIAVSMCAKVINLSELTKSLRNSC